VRGWLGLSKACLERQKKSTKHLEKIASVSKERVDTVSRLERQLEELSIREKQTKERIDALQKVPLEAIQHLEKVLEKGDRRSAWRDYMLFGLGVVVSTLIAIILKFIGF
jgi:hypothetical protein